MLSILEFAAFVALAFFGVFGSLVDFRDASGNISVKGWVGLVGVIVAASVLGLLQVYSSYQEDQRAMALLDRNTAILHEINRTLNPLQGLTAEVRLTADWSVGRLNDYFKAFERSHSSFGTVFGADPLPMPICAPDAKLTGPVLLPDGSCEKGLVVYDAFCAFEIILLFYKEPIAVEEFTYLGVGEDHGDDLRIHFSNPCSFTQVSARAAYELGRAIKLPQSAELEFDVREGRLHRLDVRMLHDDLDWQDWHGNARIISLYDLLDANLIIQLVVPFVVTSEERRKLLEAVTLRQIVLSLPQGIFLSFNENSLTRHDRENDYVFYHIKLPSTLDDLIELTSYDRFWHLR